MSAICIRWEHVVGGICGDFGILEDRGSEFVLPQVVQRCAVLLGQGFEKIE